MLSLPPQGAHASAAICSLIGTAKVCGHEPYWYLRFLFEFLAEAMTVDDFDKWIPYTLETEKPSSPAT